LVILAGIASLRQNLLAKLVMPGLAAFAKATAA
jgi:hypothetical protein